jgi:hypothetical protein
VTKRWNDHRNRNLGSVSPKNEKIFSPVRHLSTLRYPPSPPTHGPAPHATHLRRALPATSPFHRCRRNSTLSCSPPARPSPLPHGSAVAQPRRRRCPPRRRRMRPPRGTPASGPGRRWNCAMSTKALVFVPQWTDQPMNAWYVEAAWRTGVRVQPEASPSQAGRRRPSPTRARAGPPATQPFLSVRAPLLLSFVCDSRFPVPPPRSAGVPIQFTGSAVQAVAMADRRE